MKRIFSLLMAVVLVFSLVPAVAVAETSGTAYPSTQAVDVDGKKVEFQCYALKDAAGNDTNYIKLRDLADILNGSAAQFEVGWDGNITITTKTAYTKNGSEQNTPFSGQRPYEKTAVKTLVDGKETALDTFQLKDDNGGGYTYYKLRDLGTALGIKVDWSAEKGIFIETAPRVAAERKTVTMYALDGRTRETWEDEVEVYLKVGWYLNREDVYVTMYAPDGRTKEVPKAQVEANEKVGWYRNREDVYVTMYAMDGRTKEVPKAQVEANEKVGWYRNREDVYVTMYAMDGRTKEVPKAQVEANEKVGWYQDKSKVYTTLYALDGRTKDVLHAQVAENQKVGWYLLPDYLCAKADEKVSTSGYEDAVLYIEVCMALYSEQSFYNTLVEKRNSLCDAWRKQIKCPIAILDYSIGHNSIGTPEANIIYRNLTGVTINALELEFTCVDAYGNVTTDYPSLYNGTFKGYSDNENLAPYDVGGGTWTLYSNERTTSIKNLHIVRVAFSNGTGWIK